ncbi:MAG: phosphatase PAP2 family protein, partial [Sulfurovaceae bacterium]|nr:phosphatase PAP2 family protein [Sulfurovaceae bacterium]
MYIIDKNIQNKSSIKIRFLWLLYLFSLFFILYGSVNQYISLGSPPSSFLFTWEHHIPFVEWWILPYISLYPMVIIAFLLPQSNLELRVLVLRSFVIIVFSVLIFLFFPLQFSFVKPETDNFSWFITAVEMVDYPFNQAPSLHVSFSVVLWFSLANKVQSWSMKLLLALWFSIIAVSTLFVYQHHFIDLVTGGVVGFLSCYFINRKSNIGMMSSLVRAKDLKMAFFYLMGALFTIVLYFHLSTIFFILFLYLLVRSVFFSFGGV